MSVAIATRSNPLKHVMLIILAVAGLLLVIKGWEHANQRHAEAIHIRDVQRRGICVVNELYICPVQGKVVLLCQLPENPIMWGGLTFRFLENGTALVTKVGSVIYLSETGEAYEATVYMDTHAEWEKDLRRDGCVGSGTYKDVETKFLTWFMENF